MGFGKPASDVGPCVGIDRLVEADPRLPAIGTRFDKGCRRMVFGDRGLRTLVEIIDEDPRVGGEALGRPRVDAAPGGVSTGHPTDRVEHLSAIPILAKAHPSRGVIESSDVEQGDIPELEQGPDLAVTGALVRGAVHSAIFVQAVKGCPWAFFPSFCTHPSVCMIPVRNSHSS